MDGDALSLKLPKVAGRSRRRRLPRPPKFTRWERFWIILFSMLTVASIVSGYVTTVRGMIGTATYLAIIRVEFTAGLRGPGWRRTLEYWRWQQLIRCGLGAAITAQLLHSLAGIG